MHPLSEGEWKVMNAVWRKNPARVRDVLTDLEGQTTWAYTTVKTMLTRLTRKQLLDVSKQGRTSYYTPRITQPQAQRLAVECLLKCAFEGRFRELVSFLFAEAHVDPQAEEQIRQALLKLKPNPTSPPNCGE